MQRSPGSEAPAGGRVRRAWERAHYPVVMLVFAVNGSLAAFLGQRLLNDVVGVDGSLWSGRGDSASRISRSSRLSIPRC